MTPLRAPAPAEAEVPPAKGARKERRSLRAHSTVGLTPITDEELRAARMPLFALVGISWFTRRIYLDAFYRTIDDEYRAFAELDADPAARKEIAPRVAAAIRTIAAFSSWYPVVWRFVARGFAVAAFLGVAVAGAVGWNALRAQPDPVAIAAGIVATAAVLYVTVRLLLRLPRRWPYDVLALVVVGATLGTLAQTVYGSGMPFPAYVALLLAASSVATMCLVTALVLTISQGASQLVTWRKINEWPEEEVIQTTAFVLGRFHRAGPDWRLPEQRASAAENLEWIAQRFEHNLTARYAAGGSAADAAIARDAARYAAAFRARRHELAFPGASTPARFGAWLWNALCAEARNRWADLDGVTPPAATVQTVPRVAALLRNAAVVVLPAGIALAVQQLNLLGSDEALQRNVVITGFSWSLLSLLAVVNPRQFEMQASTAKTLGELLKKG